MKHLLSKLAKGNSGTESETRAIFELLMAESSDVSDAQIGAYLFATAQRLPTTDELVGGALGLRAHFIPVQVSQLAPLVDTCGTGGSGLDTFNTSTAAAFVAAGAGAYVAKHGNRAVTSRSGSADVLEALGVSTTSTPEQVQQMMKTAHFGFMFAPLHHPATKRVAMIRRELGLRTIFNFLGPLSNPASVTRQVLGVSVEKMVPVMAEALQRLGTEHALIVCGEDGLDEITLTGSTFVTELKNNALTSYTISPEDFGLPSVKPAEITGNTPAVTAREIEAMLQNDTKNFRASCKNLVALNAAAALYVAGIANFIQDGIPLAFEAIESGSAYSVLKRARKMTEELK